MEIALNNLEPDSEPDQPGPRKNSELKERENDFKGCVRGYCRISTGNKKDGPTGHS